MLIGYNNFVRIVKNAEANKEEKEKMLRKTEKRETVETVERERERATFKEVSFICDAKNSLKKLDHKMKMDIKFIFILWPIFCVQK